MLSDPDLEALLRCLDEEGPPPDEDEKFRIRAINVGQLARAIEDAGGNSGMVLSMEKTLSEFLDILSQNEIYITARYRDEKEKM